MTKILTVIYTLPILATAVSFLFDSPDWVRKSIPILFCVALAIMVIHILWNVEDDEGRRMFYESWRRDGP